MIEIIYLKKREFWDIIIDAGISEYEEVDDINDATRKELWYNNELILSIESKMCQNQS